MRQVVTGKDPEGRSIVVADGEITESGSDRTAGLPICGEAMALSGCPRTAGRPPTRTSSLPREDSASR